MKEPKKANLFRKISEICNVLPYFGPIENCDLLMTTFSTNSRKIWNDNIKIWIRILKDTLVPTKITHENIKEHTDIYSNHIYTYKLDFNIKEVLEDQKIILSFLKSLKNPIQVTSFLIKPYISSEISEFPDESLNESLKIFSEALGLPVGNRDSSKISRKNLAFSPIFQVPFKMSSSSLNSGLLVQYPSAGSSWSLSNKRQLILKNITFQGIFLLACEKVTKEEQERLSKVTTIEIVERMWCTLQTERAFTEMNTVLRKYLPNLTHIWLKNESLQTLLGQIELMKLFLDLNATIHCPPGPLHNTYHTTLYSSSAYFKNSVMFMSEEIVTSAITVKVTGKMHLSSDRLFIEEGYITKFRKPRNAEIDLEEQSEIRCYSFDTLIVNFIMVKLKDLEKIEIEYATLSRGSGRLKMLDGNKEGLIASEKLFKGLNKQCIVKITNPLNHSFKPLKTSKHSRNTPQPYPNLPSFLTKPSKSLPHKIELDIPMPSCPISKPLACLDHISSLHLIMEAWQAKPPCLVETLREILRLPNLASVKIRKKTPKAFEIKKKSPQSGISSRKLLRQADLPVSLPVSFDNL
ncbi:unnamed protein product [Moneuplotes crassus]|uniref:Uncharacterized protein n=1 Tax=Euplotes crassus TaxID=5936 RepID=A0AAD1U6B4_EUPCR|nr:unnamed protein product [Moneuplotes crassus]